jgi:signal transduction histidine kinase
VEELLDLARLEIGSLKLSLSTVNVEALIDEASSMMRSTAERNRQTIDTDVEAGLPSVRADLGRIRQVLLNLVTNATKYCPAGARIVVGARKERTHVVVFVADDGPGVPVDMQSNLFDPYVQLQAEGRNLRGLGLGLAIAKNIVELHGGKIWFDSESGKGTTVGFSLPAGGPESVSGEGGGSV